MKAARENYREPRDPRKLSRRELARRLYMSHSNLSDYENGHRFAPAEVVQAYERELKLPPGSLLDLWEQARRELLGEMRTRQRRWVPPAVITEPSPAVPTPAAEALHQLPPDIALFTGRQTELARLHALLPKGAAGTLVISAIAGTAGVGKTALALHLAHKLVPRFSDVQLFVNLHGYDALQRLSPGQVLDRFLRALGVVPEGIPTEVEEQTALYRSLLAGTRALVVLDNASSTEQVRPLLPGSPTCMVLITSRRRLAPLEGTLPFDLDIMDPDDALDFLRKLAGPERIDAEPEAANQIVALCGRLPLTLNIVGRRLAARPAWTLAWLADRLADEQTRLKELKVEDLEVRASFAFSYRDLDATAARMFRRLGLVTGPDFAADMAAVLCDICREEAEVLLDGLADAHLLEAARTPGRYRFHDLLRLYARERVQAEEEDQDRDGALRRMLEWYLDTARAADRVLSPGRYLLPRDEAGEQAEPAFATHACALAWFEAERANLVAATYQAADCGLDAIAWQLPNALFGFFDLRTYWADWQETHKVGLTAARVAHNRQAEAWTLIHLACAYGDLRRFEEAADCQEQALAISREIGDRSCEGLALGNLGPMYAHLGRLHEAIDCCRQALPIVREFGYRAAEGMNLLRLGECYRKLQDPAGAIDYGHHALAIFRELGDRYHEGLVLTNIGNACREVGRLDEAIDSLKAAAKLHRDIGGRWGEGEALQFLGVALQSAQRTDEARAYWQKALEIFTELRAPEADDVRAFLGE
jgi:tetratricopeptide (TPR) repeat protein/transcriptional regulator with XRE-family HTH domain